MWEDEVFGDACPGEHGSKLDGNEGLLLSLDCIAEGAGDLRPLHEWSATGVGAPLLLHSSFERVGGSCPPATVIVGVRFARGGCNLQDTSYREEVLNREQCEHLNDAEEGLLLELLCAEYSIVEGNPVTVVESGVGGPIITHSDFERVGGVCPDGQAATSISFRRAGCNTDTSWESGNTNMPPCDSVSEDMHEGLVLQLGCVEVTSDSISSASPGASSTATPSSTPTPTATPTATPTPVPTAIPHPNSPGEPMLGEFPPVPTLQFDPIDETLFCMQAMELLDLPSVRWCEVASQAMHNVSRVKVRRANGTEGIARVAFTLWTAPDGRPPSSAHLVLLMETDDKRLAGTYFGIADAVVQPHLPASPTMHDPDEGPSNPEVPHNPVMIPTPRPDGNGHNGHQSEGSGSVAMTSGNSILAAPPDSNVMVVQSNHAPRVSEFSATSYGGSYSGHRFGEDTEQEVFWGFLFLSGVVLVLMLMLFIAVSLLVLVRRRAQGPVSMEMDSAAGGEDGMYSLRADPTDLFDDE